MTALMVALTEAVEFLLAEKVADSYRAKELLARIEQAKQEDYWSAMGEDL